MKNNGCGVSYINSNTIKLILEKYARKCAYCGTDCIDTYHIDHKIPVSKGGDNSFDNLALSCPKCNLSKGSKTDIEFLGYKVK